MTSKKDNTTCGKSKGCAHDHSGATGPGVDEKITQTLGQIRHKLLVMSGKGGVGKSSISAALALVLASRGYQVGLLDVDIHGPSLAGMMGVKGLLDLTTDQKVLPKTVTPYLKVISMQSLMQNKDQAVIWRGPAKSGVIRQFIGEAQWGRLDFLIIDAPPGTGDEPLSVAQTIPEAKAVIVTTPQEVALADVRKSINFCRAIHLDMLGLIENMGPFACPCCGKPISLFKSNGGQATAAQMEVPFLGTLPFDPKVVKTFDDGLPLELFAAAPAFVKALEAAVEKIVSGVEE
ncbi:MAG: Mrp/NBP35 family ATP-binding protein [Desulfobacteraceae bacterium]|nr:Mrp/NBP35 family ATP-binding protein [Desulfobacteraceae bacterium]